MYVTLRSCQRFAVRRNGGERRTADMIKTVWNELDFRVDVRRITKGAHIEHL